ncbi:hypothetical protein [Luteimonas sp. 3794]|uniref:hypothetical protein n=1 Tax=Luteimonas sp. 3794 TaxID=2817730 RepID=UPI0028638913|nr:hypothetical protein [Luteimonas sp. 3794]MDR6990223.1 hypothetical protein [Luteimonas sp. 3794]
MPDTTRTDLTFPQLSYGTHQTEWDFQVLLYKGAAAARRDKALLLIKDGIYGEPQVARAELVTSLHHEISANLARGCSPHFVISKLNAIWRFIKWADLSDSEITGDSIKLSFIGWTEYLLERVHLHKNLSPQVAYCLARRVADIVARSIGFRGPNPASWLVRMTRLRNNSSRKVLGNQADKANLEETFEFGNFLADVCSGLTVEVVRGALPVTLPLRTGQTLLIAGLLKNLGTDPETFTGVKKQRLEVSRAPLNEGDSVVDDNRRTRLLTLRVEAELLIFIAQSAMNLAQAASLRRESYRWQSEGEDIVAYRVYKGRRGGEAVFRCFRAYREHWKNYLSWLDETGLSEASDKLFPFVSTRQIPPQHALPTFQAIRFSTGQLGLARFGPRSLRKARVNWLLRHSGSLALTADMAAHSRQTLLRHYEEPHHQRAAVEISRFHVRSDPNVESPGPGFCVASGQIPIATPGSAVDAPAPDCISPEGCLFCDHHRDVLSADYCWKLASHAHLKVLEVSLYKPDATGSVHPGVRVIERINLKLNEIAAGSEVQAHWVSDARDSVRAGRYHASWEGHIQLFEILG